LGNFAPSDVTLPEKLHTHPRYVANPWRFDATGVHGDLLCIGSGLTAMDVAVTLQERAFAGRLHVVSRRGAFPLVEDPFAKAADPAALALDTTSPYRLLRSMRRAARRAAERGLDWRPIVESIRAITPAIWSAWSNRERRRFLRHLESYWSMHRYRVPAETARVCSDMERRGQLVLQRGLVTGAAANGDGLRVEIATPNGRAHIDVAYVVNCTGPQSDYARIADPLVRNLLRRGLIQPDALHLGIRATADCAAVGRDGRASRALFAIGPPLRGEMYETTAIPEIRRQAAALAERLAAESALFELRHDVLGDVMKIAG
jgi:uncharacterized NAD(P)/FAD-binding protein YdhS